MAKGHKPKAGSRAFWPRKRAKRIYPRVKSAKGSEAKPLAFAAYKAGMLQAIYTENRNNIKSGLDVASAATVMDCPPLVVVGARAYGKVPRGLECIGQCWAEKLSKDLRRKTSIPKETGNMAKLESMLEKAAEIRLVVHTKPKESGVGKKTPELFEISLGGDVEKQWEYAKGKIGQELKVSDLFEEGDFVDTSAITKGKGTQGVVKRFGVTIRARKHEKKRRHIGNIGACGQARVFPGSVAMSGQLGFQKRTEWNKRILRIGSGGIQPSSGFVNYGKVPGDYIILEGSVPGPKKRLVVLTPGRRSRGRKEPAELKSVVLAAQN